MIREECSGVAECSEGMVVVGGVHGDYVRAVDVETSRGKCSRSKAGH